MLRRATMQRAAALPQRLVKGAPVLVLRDEILSDFKSTLYSCPLFIMWQEELLM